MPEIQPLDVKAFIPQSQLNILTQRLSFLTFAGLDLFKGHGERQMIWRWVLLQPPVGEAQDFPLHGSVLGKKWLPGDLQ